MRGTNIPLASNLFIVKRLARAFELRGAWDQLHSLEFHRHPARHLLVRWVHTVTELLTRYNQQGGRAGSEYSSSSTTSLKMVLHRV